MRPIYLILIVSSLLVSCFRAHLKPFTKIYLDQVDLSSNFQALDGDYEIFSVKPTWHLLSWFLLLSDQFNLGDKRPGSNDKIRIKTINNNQLKTSILNGDSIVSSKVINGKIVSRTFEFSRTKIAPFYFILNFYHHQKVRIVLMKNGDIMMDQSRKAVAFSFFLPVTGANEENYSIRFRKISTIVKD